MRKVLRDDISRIVDEFGISRQNAAFKIQYYSRDGRNAFEVMWNKRLNKQAAEQTVDVVVEKKTICYCIKDGKWVEAFNFEVANYVKT